MVGGLFSLFIWWRQGAGSPVASSTGFVAFTSAATKLAAAGLSLSGKLNEMVGVGVGVGLWATVVRYIDAVEVARRSTCRYSGSGIGLGCNVLCSCCCCWFLLCGLRCVSGSSCLLSRFLFLFSYLPLLRLPCGVEYCTSKPFDWLRFRFALRYAYLHACVSQEQSYRSL